MNKHLRVFLNAGIAFGVTATVLLFMKRRPLLDVVILGVIAGILFGAGMAWLSMRTERRLLAKGFTLKDMSPVQERVVSLTTTQSEALMAARVALNKLPRIKDILVDDASGTISARVGGSWKSSGENLIVSVSQVGSSSIVKIRSEPRTTSAVVDAGAGIENVETFIRAMRPLGNDRADT